MLTTSRAIFLFVAQLIGGIIASALVLALIPSGAKGVDVVNTTISGQTSPTQAVILEFLGTSVLVFSVLMLAVEKVGEDLHMPNLLALTIFQSTAPRILHPSALASRSSHCSSYSRRGPAAQ